MTGPLTRRSVLRSGLAAASVGLAGCSSPGSSSNGSPDGTTTGTQSDTPATTDGSTSTTTNGSTGTPSAAIPETVSADPIATGLTAPLDIAFPDIPGVRAYIADQAGSVAVLAEDGLRSTPLLDVRDRMVELGGYEERGLLGIALHPDFRDTGRLFVRYSGKGASGGYSHTFVLSEFSVRADGLAVDPGSERRLLEIPEPQSNHNAGPIVFGPDDYLYVAVGDGGGGGDQGTGHVADWYLENDGGNGQDVTENLLGSILRIDVDATQADRPYAIPPDNPLVGADGLDEHYAWGFRNPWGMSFTESELFVADVGQNRFEEVDLVEMGGNYGWNVREATHCFSTESPGEPPESCPSGTPDGEPLIDPIIEYSHGGAISGVAVVGGYLYSGTAIPGFEGRYVFSDWRANSRLYVASRPNDAGLWPITAVDVDGPQSFGSNILGFGRDRSDELYVLTTRRSTVSGSTGAVHRLVSE